jgi:hypothetical protein
MTKTPDGFSSRARTPIAAQERAQARASSASGDVVRLWTACPQADRVTAYDMQHLYIFNWLLNAEYEGAAEHEMARVIFHIDAARQPVWAQTVVRSHLHRAHWLRNGDFPYLDW